MTTTIRSKEPFGATAVRLGYATSGDIVKALEEQAARRQKNGGEAAVIGAVMVEMGILDPNQVSTVLASAADRGYTVTEDALRLAARLQATLAPETRVIAVSGEGKRREWSQVAAQVALALAGLQDERVLLVDACLRTGEARRLAALNNLFGLQLHKGLTDILAGKAVEDDVVVRNQVPHLDILPTGDIPDDPATLFMGRRCAELFTHWRSNYRYVIVEIPPLLERSDGPILASHCDGVILVATAGKQRRSRLEEAIDLLNGINRPLIGVVLRRH